MDILVVSYVDGITSQIKDVIEKKYKNSNIFFAKGTLEAKRLIYENDFDLIVIDMLTQEYFNEITEPLLKPAIQFLKYVSYRCQCIKVFSLFDEAETGKKGQTEIEELGYEIASYDCSSLEWKEKLFAYI